MVDFKVDVGVSSGVVTNVSESLKAAFKATSDIEEKLDGLESTINDAIPEKVDICHMEDTIKALTSIQQQLTDIASSLTSGVTKSLSGNPISIDVSVNVELGGDSENPGISPDMLQYVSTGIIMKRFQILKYRLEKMKLVVERMALEEVEKVFVWVLEGESSLMTAPINAALAALSTIAAAIAVIMNILGIILSALSALPIINVKSASCAFLLTPKSMNTTDITIANSNQSTTNNIPKPIDIAASEASTVIDTANKVIVDSGIKAMSAAGSATALTGFDPGEFPAIPKFDEKKVQAAINLILMAVLDADALPRYEKLSPINPRFLVFLVSGFEPAAFQTFGIPGQP